MTGLMHCKFCYNLKFHVADSVSFPTVPYYSLFFFNKTTRKTTKTDSGAVVTVHNEVSWGHCTLEYLVNRSGTYKVLGICL